GRWRSLTASLEGSVGLFAFHGLDLLRTLFPLQLMQHRQERGFCDAQAGKPVRNRLPDAALDQGADAAWPLEGDDALRRREPRSQAHKLPEPLVRAPHTVNDTHKRRVGLAVACIHEQSSLEDLEHYNE